MTAAPAVTVVIPTHNRRDLLMRTLRSVLDQEGITPDVIVVDDGGRDGTADAVRALQIPSVRVVRHEQGKGVSAARNAGLARVRTPWVAFVDDDDLWAPHKLRRQLATLEAEPWARWSYVGALHVDSELRVTRYTAPPDRDHLAQGLRRRNVVPGGGSGLVADTELARRIGGFDERISLLADWDFNLRMLQQAPAAVVDEPLVAYYVHSDSMLHDPRAYLRELTYMVGKHRRPHDGAGMLHYPADWHVYLAGMARRLGQRDTAREILAQGMREAGTVSVARDVAVRVLRRLAPSRRRSRTVAPAPWLQAYDDRRPDPRDD